MRSLAILNQKFQLKNIGKLAAKARDFWNVRVTKDVELSWRRKIQVTEKKIQQQFLGSPALKLTSLYLSV
jgi:hypothetical protein